MNYQIRDKRPPTEEREAKKEQSRKDAEKVLAARKKADDAFRANFERLKAERLARQAAGKILAHILMEGGSTPDYARPRAGGNRIVTLL